MTRIKGITERPRHMIDCKQYVSELKSCDEFPKWLYVDAEYCATLDHTGKPISEYGEQLGALVWKAVDCLLIIWDSYHYICIISHSNIYRLLFITMSKILTLS